MTASAPLIRILVAQNHDRAIARAGLCRLLESHERLIVVGESGNYEDTLRVATEQCPDVVLLDAGACDDGELALIAALVEANEKWHIIVLTSSADLDAQRKAISLGAMGLVQQGQPVEVLFKAIECVYAGEIWLERAMAANVLREKTRPQPAKSSDPQNRIATLTEREREVIVFICQGLKNQAIADRLFISEATVRHRLTSIFEKLKVADRLELVIFAYQHGLAELPS